MMKKLTCALCLLLALLMVLPALAETENPVVATVNGENVFYDEYAAIESVYLYQYMAMGLDVYDNATYAYVQDLAMTHVIEQKLVEQDMRAQGCFDVGAENEAWCVEQGHLAWENALADVGEMMRQTLDLTEDFDMREYALSYADGLGVNEQTYVDEFRMQLAQVNYYEWLLGENAITDEVVQAAYEARVAASREMYAENVAAFEAAVSGGSEVWFVPEGYRRVLQILLPAQGEDDAARLSSVQATVEEINTRLEGGEAFTALIAEYGTDANFANESFYETGYQVHRESAVWEDAFVAAAFSERMAAPGCWSEPFASDLGVHILYYLSDVPGGALEMTEEVRDALSYVLYTEMSQAALAERINALAESAEIVFH